MEPVDPTYLSLGDSTPCAFFFIVDLPRGEFPILHSPHDSQLSNSPTLPCQQLQVSSPFEHFSSRPSTRHYTTPAFHFHRHTRARRSSSASSCRLSTGSKTTPQTTRRTTGSGLRPIILSQPTQIWAVIPVCALALN